ncbi:hypothetical protein ScPMuIL_017706 [Solemya velum]
MNTNVVFPGLQKLGIGVALVNYNLRTSALVHTIITNPLKALIVGEGEGFFQAVDEIKHDLDDLAVYVQGLPQTQLLPGYKSWDDLMHTSHPVPVCKSVRDEMFLDLPCCYINTSGTTGLSKPVIVSQRRAISAYHFIQRLQLSENDIVYTSIPLYHSAALCIGLFGVIYKGATIALRRKFSAHHFWEDCRRHKVTVAQYIGELCRYVLSVPESPLDVVHNVRAMIGNGLRRDIWAQFQNRFNVPHIVEFFGATEGPVVLFNVTNTVGAVGRLSPLLQWFQSIKCHLIKYDPETEEAIRDKNGHCIEIKPGENGLIICSIPEDSSRIGFYKADENANEKKILRDVFQKGDDYFLFGDVLHLDRDYFLYFVDRLGDTFRWKGENVATYEVANVLSKLDFIHDANVYGVKIPGSEGRAGMAAIFLNDSIEVRPHMLDDIYTICEDNLPQYARPLFLRFSREWDQTSTFKQRKYKFVQEGFNQAKVTDPLFYRNEKMKTYSQLNASSLSTFLTKSRL